MTYDALHADAVALAAKIVERQRKVERIIRAGDEITGRGLSADRIREWDAAVVALLAEDPQNRTSSQKTGGEISE